MSRLIHSPTSKQCKLVQLSRERQQRDLSNEHWDWFPYKFDKMRAARVIEFSRRVKHTKGVRWAYKPFELESWQSEDIIEPLFGWVRKDNGCRRFRDAYNEVARKNGKTTLAAMVALYLTIADGEPVAEVYSAATKIDQAKLVHDEAIRMVKSSPTLRRFVKILRNNIHVPHTMSKFVPLAADADSLDGLNPHGAIIDELHAHKDRRVYDILETATGSRSQPMLFSITTAGFDRNTICWEKHNTAVRILEQSVEDDTFFAFIATLDDDDDWADASKYYKANPNLGISVSEEQLLVQRERALHSPGFQNTFRRLRLNQWTEQSERFIDMKAWRACGGDVDEKALKGRPCWMGLDLSSTTDFTALVLLFPVKAPDGKMRIKVISRFWLPEGTVAKRALTDRMPYDAWRDQGILFVTPGNAIDYEFVAAEILKLAQQYQVKELCIDRYNALQISQKLEQAGLTVSLVGQGWQSMSAPMKELLTLVLDKRIEHGNNPILTWMAGNLAVSQNPAGDLKPDKERSIERIDGMAALVTALFRLMSSPVFKKSVYATRGIQSV